jgi:sodium/potassium-transporting ATPase subunit alpha
VHSTITHPTLRYRAANPKLFEIKFNSTNKWQLSVHTDTEAGPGAPPQLVLKGAPERVRVPAGVVCVMMDLLAMTPAWKFDHDMRRVFERPC